MVKKLILKSVGLVMIVGLSACSTYQESFDCPIGEGIPCASLSKVSKKMDRGEIQIEDLDDQKDDLVKDTTVSYGMDFASGLKG